VAFGLVGGMETRNERQSYIYEKIKIPRIDS
jgi:hypothetical protein